MENINNYYGSKTALYFGFLEYYNNLLLMPCIIGLILFMYQIFDDDIDVDMLPLFCIFIAIWGTFLLEYWKRKCAELTFSWGIFGSYHY